MSQSGLPKRAHWRAATSRALYWLGKGGGGLAPKEGPLLAAGTTAVTASTARQWPIV